MSDEKQPSKAQQTLAAHGEKIGLVMAILALVVYFGLFVVMAEDDPLVRNTKGLVDQVNMELNKGHDNLKPGEAPKLVVKSLDPWQRNLPAASGNDWSVAYRTKPETRMIAKTVIKETRYEMATVTIQDAVVELEGVTVAWDVEAVEEKTKLKEAPIDHFILERAVEGGSFSKLKEFDADTSKYRDGDIKPRTNYRYRLYAVTTHTKFKRQKGTDKGRKTRTIAAKTLGIFQFKVISAVPPTVYMEVVKFEPGVGRVSKKFIYKPGDKIGAVPFPKEIPDDFVPKFKHMLTPEGGRRPVEIDLNSGAQLNSVKEIKLTLERKSCKRNFDGQGRYIGCDEKKEPYPFTTKEVIYTDDEGAEVKLYFPPPSVRHNLCDEHGGGMTEKEPKEEDPDMAEDKAREKKAKELYEKAGKLWRKDKGAAQAIYKTLIAEYGTTKYFKKKEKDIRKRAEEE